MAAFLIPKSEISFQLGSNRRELLTKEGAKRGGIRMGDPVRSSVPRGVEAREPVVEPRIADQDGTAVAGNCLGVSR